MTEQKQWKMKTTVGDLYLVATKNGLSGALWHAPKFEKLEDIDGKDSVSLHIRNAVRELTEYFCGDRTVFDIKLDMQGTDFQKKVWEELKKIPYGETISYRELAKRVHNEKACRAVGSANGKNPVSIIVPCHRVITSNGTIGGYAGGLTAKRKLLALELDTKN